MLKILTFTSLFPNTSQPSHGLFVKQRLRQLLLSGEIESKVVAPIPYYPNWMPDIGSYGQFKHVLASPLCENLEVIHPRYPVIPKFGMTVAPHLMAYSVFPVIKRLYEDGFNFDLIDAHYFYPDGVAAAIIARKMHLPFVVTARGSDINLIPRYRMARRKIINTANAADAVITVSDALRDRLVKLGVDESKVRTLRNGVDPEIFCPVDREQAKVELGITDKTLLSVGHLIKLKGHHLTIQALAGLPDFKLVIVGNGKEEQKLKSLAEQLGIQERVRFEGEVAQSRLKYYFSACDASILASSREGMANVLLESMACGCPVIATNICGAPEVVQGEEAGILINDRSPEAISEGVKKLFSNLPDRLQTLRYSTKFSWKSTTCGQLEIFSALAERGSQRN